MPRQNFWIRPLQTRTSYTKTFQDYDQETGLPRGEPFDLTFWTPTEPEITQALELRDALKERYVGDPEEDIPPLIPFAPVGGKQIEVTATMCLNGAYMQFMQPSTMSPDDKYSAEDFIAMRASLCEKTRNAVDLFMRDVKKPKKKGEVLEDPKTGTPPNDATSEPLDSA